MIDQNEWTLAITKLKMEESNKMLEWMGSIAKLAFSYLILVNGTAIISILTFIGNSKTIINFSSLWFWAIPSFCVGICCGILGITFAFWSQKLFREGVDADIRNGTESKDDVKNNKGLAKRSLSVTFTVFSLLCFVAGCVFAICALSTSF